MVDPDFSKLMAAATIQIQDGQWERARLYLERALVLVGKEHGPDHPHVLPVLDPLVQCCDKLGDKRACEDYRDRAISITIASRLARGKIRATQFHDYKAAEQLFSEALSAAEPHFGRRHRETATVLTNYGVCLRSQGRFHKALGFLEEGLDIRQEVLGPEHVHTAQSYCEVGKTYRMTGRYKEAEHLLQQSLRIRTRELGKRHPEVAESLNGLAGLYRELGRYDEARPLAEEALDIRAEALGPQHELTAASKNNLALILARDRTPTGGSGLVEAAEAAPDSAVTPAAPRPLTAEQVSWEALRISGTAVAALVIVALIAAGLIAVPGPLRPLLALAAGGVVAGIVALMTAVTLVYDRSWDEQLQGAAVWLRRAVSEKDDGAVDDRRALGVATAFDRLALEDDARIVQLDATNARRLARMDPLQLNHVRGLSEGAAYELSRQQGRLELNGLVNFPSKLARPLRGHAGSLFLNGVQQLSQAAAAHIARHRGDLHFDGLFELSPEAAKHLANHRPGLLALGGLRTLEEAAATALARHRGRVQLTGLRLVTAKTKKILESSSMIELSSDLGTKG
jgi:tetratricopeptide (TPR) repeat protein